MRYIEWRPVLEDLQLWHLSLSKSVIGRDFFVVVVIVAVCMDLFQTLDNFDDNEMSQMKEKKNKNKMEVKEMTMILKLAVDKMKNETENRFIIKTMEMGKIFFLNLIPVYVGK